MPTLNRPLPAVWTATLILLLGAGSGAAAENSAMTAARLGIDAGQLQSHVNVLADDSFEGREAGSRGGHAAAGYLVKHFRDAGLQGAGDDGGYFQAFDSNSRNLLARIEGSDPKLKDQVLLIGAHYDHVGLGTSGNSKGGIGNIHNGADDNASGTAGILELIGAFTSLPSPPRRSIVFAFWDGEEKGLLGSKHWVAQPTIPLGQIVATINIDMIGRLRNDRLQMFGTRSGVGLRQLISRQNGDSLLKLNFTWELKANSDHYSFFERDIPIIMPHTGLHDDYHRPSDDADKVNADGMQHVTRLIFDVAGEIANQNGAIKFRHTARSESVSQQRYLERSLPLPGSRLGVRWNEESATGETGLLLDHVASGSPAEKAGLLPGDRIVTFSGNPISGSDSLRNAVFLAPKATEVVVHRPDAKEPLTLTIVLNGSPARLGIAWREDPAEPGSIFLVQVRPGSPAERVGLRNGDRIYEIAGQTFGDSEQFEQLATSLPMPISLMTEREGQLRQVELSPFVSPIELASATDSVNAKETATEGAVGQEN